MMQHATTSIFPWPQVLTMNHDTMTKLHEDNYRELEWNSEYGGQSLTGKQKHHGHISFNPDPNEIQVNGVVGYTFSLNGTITLGNPPTPMRFTKWTFLLYVVPGRVSISQRLCSNSSNIQQRNRKVTPKRRTTRITTELT